MWEWRYCCLSGFYGIAAVGTATCRYMLLFRLPATPLFHKIPTDSSTSTPTQETRKIFKTLTKNTKHDGTARPKTTVWWQRKQTEHKPVIVWTTALWWSLRDFVGDTFDCVGVHSPLSVNCMSLQLTASFSISVNRLVHKHACNYNTSPVHKYIKLLSLITVTWVSE